LDLGCHRLKLGVFGLDSLLTLAANSAAFLLEATEALAISWMYFRILSPTSAI
jgi:hypothetical protein